MKRAVPMTNKAFRTESTSRIRRPNIVTDCSDMLDTGTGNLQIKNHVTDKYELLDKEILTHSPFFTFLKDFYW
jgi:hypothetical protein